MGPADVGRALRAGDVLSHSLQHRGQLRHGTSRARPAHGTRAVGRGHRLRLERPWGGGDLEPRTRPALVPYLGCSNGDAVRLGGRETPPRAGTLTAGNLKSSSGGSKTPSTSGPGRPRRRITNPCDSGHFLYGHKFVAFSVGAYSCPRRTPSPASPFPTIA